MAYYVPQFGSCFGASCSDIFPGAAGAGPGVGLGPGSSLSPGSALGPYLPSFPGVNVSVGLESGGPGAAMVPYAVESAGLPWWLWLAIGVLVARAMD